MLSSVNTQIKTDYEAGSSVQDIAEEQGFEVMAVKAILLQTSKKYRADCRTECGMAEEELEDPKDFTDEELVLANGIIKEVALCAQLPDGSPDYRTRLMAATYIRDDKKGRKEAKAMIQHNTNNIFTINDAIAKARVSASERIQQVMGSKRQEMIEA